MCGIAHKRFCFIDWREYPMGRVSVWIDAPLSSDFPGGICPAVRAPANGCARRQGLS